MAGYDDDDYEPRSRGYRDDRGPPPYPSSAAPFDGYQGAAMPPPPPGGPPQGTDVPPPPLGDQVNRQRPSAMKRSGSQSRVPHLQPQFPEEASYLGSQAPDLEAKKGRRHREFRDRRDGYESEEGEMLRQAKPRDYDDSRRRGGDRGDPYDDRGAPPPRRKTYDDDEEPRRRRDKDRDRDRDRDYDDPPSRHRRKDPPGVEYGSEPVPAVRRSQTDRDRRPRRRDDRDDDDDYDDRRRPERRRSHDDSHRRRRDYDDDDRSEYDRDRDRDRDRRRRDDRDRDRDDRRRGKSRDRSRRRYSDDESDYDDRRDRDRDSRKRRSSAPPKEIKIGDYDIGPLVAQGKKHYGTVAPILAPIAMQMARKYLSGSKR